MDAARRTLARPHLVRAAIAGIVALVALIVSGSYEPVEFGNGLNGDEPVALIVSGILLVTGIMAVRALSSAARKASEDKLGPARGGSLGFLIQVAGYFILATTVLTRVGINLQGLVLGGALTGIVIGIAAQQTLGNLIAGVVLMLVRPFAIGEHVVLKSGPLGGEYEGLVTDMSLFYVHIQTAGGPVALPSAGVLASAIGPGVRSPKADDPESEEQDPGSQHGGTPAGT